jgi:hypothetical protein
MFPAPFGIGDPTPYYFGHFSWIPLLNNEYVEDGGIPGSTEGTTFMDWLFAQSKVISTQLQASVTKLAGNKNEATITITEEFYDGTFNIISATFPINNNAAGVYMVGDYNVYLDTKGNDQVRECYIVG